MSKKRKPTEEGRHIAALRNRTRRWPRKRRTLAKRQAIKEQQQQ